MRRLPTRPLVLLALLAASLGSCAKPSPPPVLVPVRGVVLYRSKPLPSVQVEFLPEAAEGAPSSAASAWTGPDGSFTLHSHPHGPGAAPGRYRVCVTSYPGAAGPPEVYGDPTATPLRLDVPEGGLENPRIQLRD